MRVNIYSQELTDEVELVEQVSDTGVIYSGIRFYLHSSEHLHHPPKDDDRSAITFWLPRSNERRLDMTMMFEQACTLMGFAKPETGLD